MSQDVEVVQDDEDEIRGRQIHIRKDTVVRETTEDSEAHGDAAFKRMFSALLVVLRHQIKFLTEKYNLSPYFEHIMRILFINWANKTNLSLKGDAHTSAYSLNLLVLLRIGMHCIDAPVYFMDLLQSIKTGELVYMWPRRIPEVRELLKGVIISHSSADPWDVPNIKSAQELYFKMQAKMKLPLAPFDVKPLVLKLVRNLFLPPSIYTVATHILGLTTPKQGFGDMEVRAGACVWAALKLVYAFGQNVQVFDAPNWNVWADVTRKYWNNRDGFWSCDERDVESWDYNTEQEFLGFYRSVFGSDLVEAKGVSQRRLFSLLPLLESYSHHSKGDDAAVHNELFDAVLSTRADSPHPAVDTYHLHDDLTDLDPVSAVLENCLCQLLATSSLALEDQLRFVEQKVRLFRPAEND